MRGGISLDALVLVMVTGLTLHLDSYTSTTYTSPVLNAIAVGLLGLYVVLDVLAKPLLLTRRTVRLYYGAKGLVLAAMIGLLLIWPTVHLIALRHSTQPWMYVHDTSINVEEATKYLLAGKDPYSQTYFNTPLAKFAWYTGRHYGYGSNPALWWTDTFPGQELVTAPFLLASKATLGWFDERFVFLLALAISVCLLLKLAPTPSTRLALVAGVALNPLWVPTFIYGQNDILVLAAILAVLWLSSRNRWRLALLALALGCATKQTTLILVPFYLWWLVLRLGDGWPRRLERLALLLPWFVAPLVLMVGPFAAWDWRGFYNGNFAYVAGTIPHSYPIQGYDALGAASFVLWSGLVPSPNSPYPFWILEVAAAVPLAALLLRRMQPTTPVTVMVGAYATVLFAIFYFSRFFHPNYAAFTIDLLLVAYLAHRSRASQPAVATDPARQDWTARLRSGPGRDGPAGPVIAAASRWSGAAWRVVDDGFVSFDVIVLLVLVPQVIAPPVNRASGIVAALAFGVLLAYVAVAALAPWGRQRDGWRRRCVGSARAVLLAGLAEVVIFGRTLDTITNRLRWNAASTLIHDTALQVQISAGELLKGRNPYTISFWNTPLPPLYVQNVKPGQHLAPRADMPLLHNPHLPLDIALGAPPQALFNRLHLLFDERYLYLFALLSLAVVVTLLAREPIRQLALLGAVLFSPLFAAAVIQGQDDVIVLLAVVVALMLFQRGHYTGGALAVGIACAVKLTAWPLAPLLLAYFAGLDRHLPLRWWQRAGAVVKRATVVSLPVVITALPFVLRNPRALWGDAIAYPLGLMRDAIPLNVVWGRGFQTIGFGRIAWDLHWAHLNGTGYIGPWLELGCGGVVLAVLIVRLWQTPALPLLMGGYMALLFTLEYFGRFMIDTSLGYLIVLAPLSYFVPQLRLVEGLVRMPEPALTITTDAAAAVR
jgi:hypothetical protein